MSYPSFTKISLLKLTKLKLKQSLIGDIIYNRNIHVYSVGLERTGTSFINSIFSTNFRSLHEPEWRLLMHIMLYTNNQNSDIILNKWKNWFIQRDRSLRLEVESSHFLGPFVPLLKDTFPESKFILTIRHPKSWLKSVVNWQLNHSLLQQNNRWKPVIDNYYKSHKPALIPILKNNGLFSLDGYLNKWYCHNKLILDSVPRERLLVLKTTDLSRSLDQISDFIKVPKSKIVLPSKREHNSNPKLENFIESIPKRELENSIRQNCKDIYVKYFDS